MSDYIELGSVPSDETCAQLGENPDFYQQNGIETAAYKHQLERKFPGLRFVVKTFPYDSGSYSEVCVVFSTDEEGEQAYIIENMLPDRWDAEAVAELKAAGYRHLATSTDCYFCR
jgi:hypothetical protein